MKQKINSSDVASNVTTAGTLNVGTLHTTSLHILLTMIKMVFMLIKINNREYSEIINCLYAVV
jgi:hypothetical protein